MENWKAVAYLLGFGQGLILSISLVVRGLRQHRANLFLGLILLVLVQELLNAWAMQIRYHSRPDAFHFWNFQSYLVLPVALWFFLRYQTERHFIFKPLHWLYFIPILAEIAIRWAWQWLRSFSQRPVPSLLENPIWFFTTEILPIIGMVAVLGWYGFKLLRAVKNRAVCLESQPRLAVLFAFFLLLTLLWIGGVILELPVFTEIEMLIMACLIALGYIGYLDPGYFTRPALATSAEMPEDTEQQPAKPDFSRFDDQQSLQKLEAFFVQNKEFTRPGLTLDDAAGELRLPARYVSYLINTHSNTNFNGYVNAYRVQEVLRKLADPREQHKTILALAFESGFSSKSTFNAVFKQQTGQSPSQFLQSRKAAGEA